MEIKNLLNSQYEDIIEFLTQFDFKSHKPSSVTILKLISGSLVGLGAVYVFKIWNSYQFFKRRGVNTVSYKFFYGNYKEIFDKMKYSDTTREWTQKYGKTYGYFEGHYPILVTSDLNIIQEVYIKQAANFSARKKFFIAQGDDNPTQDLFTSSRLRWKKMRNIMNPTFSSSKLRELSPDLVKCTDRLIEILESNTDHEINVLEFFKRYTMDTIWNCAFGIDANIQIDPSNEYYVNCERAFRLYGMGGIAQFIGMYFHEFKSVTFSVLMLINKLMSKFVDLESRIPLFWFYNRVFELVDKRKVEGIRKRDYLQILIDAENESSKDDQSNEVNYTNVNFEKKMTLDEIKQNMTLFMFAGYETTSTTLGNCIHMLAKYQDEQTRLYDEIRSFFDSENDPKIDSDSVQKIEYLDMVIKEVMRLYPVGDLARRCTKRTNVKGIDIPEDLVVAVDILTIHNDPEIWGPVDPKKFYPDRFSKEIKRNPISFMGFGIGPRNCLGMKFAMTELKVAICKILLKYEILQLANDKKDLEIFEVIIRVPVNGIRVTLKKRNT